MPQRRTISSILFFSVLLIAVVVAFLLGGHIVPPVPPPTPTPTGNGETPTLTGSVTPPGKTAAQGSTPTPTESSVTYPKLALQYTGSLHDTTCVNSSVCYCKYANGQPNPQCDSTLTLSSLVQHHNELSGYFTHDGPNGNGPFTGVITSDGKISFTVTSHDNISLITEVCTGTLHSDGSMSGTWQAFAAVSQVGTWQVSPN